MICYQNKNKMILDIDINLLVKVLFSDQSVYTFFFFYYWDSLYLINEIVFGLKIDFLFYLVFIQEMRNFEGFIDIELIFIDNLYF